MLFIKIGKKTKNRRLFFRGSFSDSESRTSAVKIQLVGQTPIEWKKSMRFKIG